MQALLRSGSEQAGWIGLDLFGHLFTRGGAGSKQPLGHDLSSKPQYQKNPVVAVHSELAAGHDIGRLVFGDFPVLFRTRLEANAVDWISRIAVNN